MREVKDFLVKFENILASSEVETNTIIKAIKEVTGISVSASSIKRKGKSIFLSIKPIYKSEIFLKQEKLLNKLKELSPRSLPESIS